MSRFIKERLPLVVFISVIFILGICFGTVAVKTVDYEVKRSLFCYFNDFMKEFEKIDYDQKSLIGESIKFNLFNILIIWGFGLSLILMPLIAVLIFLKGFVLGFTVGFLVSEYSFKGVGLAAVSIFPQNILIIPGYVLAAVVGVQFSLKIINYYRRRENLVSYDFINYTKEMLILALVLLGGSLLETYFSPFILRLFLKFIKI